jgi:hypothetical protein
VSLTVWKKHGEVSLAHDRTVSQLVEKYRRDFPGLEKRFIRRLILAEYKQFFENPSEVRKLTRELEKAYKNEAVQPSSSLSGQPLNEWAYRKWLIEHEEETNPFSHANLRKAFQQIAEFQATHEKGLSLEHPGRYVWIEKKKRES